MDNGDKRAFAELITALGELHEKVITKAMLGMYWSALQHLDIKQVQQAVNAHNSDPERGRWMPKPSDLLLQIDGTATEQAVAATCKVESAVRNVGPWRQIVFDDPVIHRVIVSMGGWIRFCLCGESEWPHLLREFGQRYGLMARQVGQHQPLLMAETVTIGQPVYIGDPAACRAVQESGSQAAALEHISEAVDRVKFGALT